MSLQVQFDDEKARGGGGGGKHLWHWSSWRRRRDHCTRHSSTDDAELALAENFGSPALQLKSIENSIFHAEVSVTPSSTPRSVLPHLPSRGQCYPITARSVLLCVLASHTPALSYMGAG